MTFSTSADECDVGSQRLGQIIMVLSSPYLGPLTELRAINMFEYHSNRLKRDLT